MRLTGVERALLLVLLVGGAVATLTLSDPTWLLLGLLASVLVIVDREDVSGR